MPNSNTQKPGLATTEFWGKSIIQLAILISMIFDLDIEITDAQALAIAGGLEAAYTVGRSFVKGRSAQP